MNIANNEDVEVTIRNLPNEAKEKEILDYLETAGPIKVHRFHKDEERFSVMVVYHDYETAEICRKYLGERYFKGRMLTISYEQKRNYPANLQFSEEQMISKTICSLSREEKRDLLGMLKKLKNEEGRMFESFLENKPKIVDALLQRQY